MKKIMNLLAVLIIPATLSGCASCPTLCPCCPCNWFNRPAPCPPPPTYCPPPMAASPCAAPFVAAPCAPAATQMMPQYVMPTAAPMSSCATCQQAPMQYSMAQPSYYTEASCGYSMMEPSCGGGNVVSYGPMMDCGPCGGGCCDGGMLSAPSPEAFNADPRPVAE